MKFNETILGSIIIGTLIGGAILISSAMSTEGKPKIKVMSLADGDRQEQVIHKEVIFDMNMKMFLRDNFIHGDLHAGNLLYDEMTDTITVLDAGLISQVSRSN